GQDRGRIYRIRPASGTAHQPVKVAQANPESQVALLDHPTAWIRRTAQQRLVEAGDHANEAALSLALKQHGPKGRMHAMWTLEGLGLLTAAQWTEALKDEHPGVRVQALNLIEGRAQWWNLYWPLIQNLARDPDPSDRFHAALLLGKHPHPDNLSALKALWLQDWSDQWARRAILSSLREHPGNFLLSLLETGPEGDANAEPWHTALRDIAFMVGARIDGATMTSTLGCLDRLSQILKQGYGDRVQGILEGLSEGLKLAGRNASLGEAIYPALESLLITDDLAVRRSIWQISRIMGLESLPGFDQAHQEAILMASNPKADIEARLMALELLSLANFNRSGPTFLACLSGLEPLKLQQKALELLRQYKEIEVAQEVITRWREIGPGLRPQVIGLLLARRPFHLPLIDAIESGTLSLGELNLDLEQRRLLLRYSSEAVRTRAARWLGDEEYSHRRANLDERVAAMPAAGRAQEGASLFGTHCASCHRSGSLGHAVGPDLSDLSHRSVEDLAYNILDPNMAIHPDYIAYEAETAEGELITGIPSAQSEDSVT
ncbi:MAG: HEAT repeat domain-containing protein, partial [Verrucomicrobiota bacterium]